jgi:hypothetical protein
MPCVRVGQFLVNMAPPSEFVTMANGRRLELEWHEYFGPAAVNRTEVRLLTAAEFRDPNVDAWIVRHGGKSCLEDKGPLLRKPRRRKPEPFDPSKPVKPKIVHKVSFIDQEGNSSALCFAKPHAVDLSRETVTVYGEPTCPKCRKRLAELARTS